MTTKSTPTKQRAAAANALEVKALLVAIHQLLEAEPPNRNIETAKAVAKIAANTVCYDVAALLVPAGSRGQAARAKWVNERNGNEEKP